MNAAMHRSRGILEIPFLSKRWEIEASKRIEKKSGKKRNWRLGGKLCAQFNGDYDLSHLGSRGSNRRSSNGPPQERASKRASRALDGPLKRVLIEPRAPTS